MSAANDNTTTKLQQSAENKMVQGQQNSTIATESQPKTTTVQQQPSQREVRILTLVEGETFVNGLYRVSNSWILRLVLSSSLSATNVRLFTNSPRESHLPFVREQYRELEWLYPSECKYDSSSRYASIECVKSGSFHYYFTVDGSDDQKNLSGSGYFIVEPKLTFPDGIGDVLPIDCIECQSVLSKSLGPFEEWESRLLISKYSGYNMVHFTPIQKLYHISNSSYAITNHHILNPLFGENTTHDDIKKLVDKMAKEWRIFSITDLVYNHAANDCELLKEHPEAAYNLVNSPHLKPPFLLDAILMQFTKDCQDGVLEPKGIPSAIKDKHLPVIRRYFLNDLLPKYKLHEYYTINVEETLKEFRELLSTLECPLVPYSEEDHLIQIKHGKYERLKSTVDLDLASQIYYYKRSGPSSHDDIEQACEALSDRLIYLNHIVNDKIQEHLVRAVDNTLGACRYHFFAHDGPNFERITLQTPFVGNYFAYPNGEFKHPDEIEQLIETDITYQSYCMAHNGWVMNDDPLRNFAEEGQDVYLRRDLLQWSDIIKLRFGQKYEDSPALWDYMKEYTRLVATTFHGARLDNCHSTPLVVAQTLMDYARELNPEFYILAELFTGSDQTDTVFVNKLAINSLVRESMHAWDPYELGRLTARFGGDAIGSFFQPSCRPILPLMTHSFYYDQTHDNPCPIERRSVQDVLPRAACVAMACCANGSNRGYDELVPHHIDVVHERRFYPKAGNGERESNESTNLIPAKLIFNKLHHELCSKGYDQMAVDQLSTAALVITRYNLHNHQSIILIAHTAFSEPKDTWEQIKPLYINGHIDEVLYEMTISISNGAAAVKNFVRDKTYINNLQQVTVQIREHLPVDQSQCVNLRSSNRREDNNDRHITFDKHFPPGTIICFKVSLLQQVQNSIIEIRKNLNEFTDESGASEFQQIINKLTLLDLNRVLYRNSNEEQADGLGIDVYEIPGYGKLVYCGLQGFMSVLEKIRLTNELKHPLCQHLKDGFWCLDYISSRLIKHRGTQAIGQWYEKCFRQLKRLPKHLLPAYFDLIITGSYTVLIEHAWRLMGPFVQKGSTFVRALSMASVILCGLVKDAQLPALSPNLKEPKPIELTDDRTGLKYPLCPTLGAGLPHFAAAVWRNWGRDTFIALRGLMLITGRFDEARYLILGYGQCLRHGLIPNLLGDGRIARYNARDAVWWWLYSIGEYIHMAPHGHEILEDKVSRLYPTHDSQPQPPGLYDQHLYEVIQEALTRHAQSLTYRERGAGYNLDMDMSDEGFNNRIGVDFETGFVYGGNSHNCGTWMDKMGSSAKAGNKGKPGSPRDGSAVELVGLCRATLKWLIKANKEGYYPYDNIKISTSNIHSAIVSSTANEIQFQEWMNKIDSNFEKYFWIDELDQTSHFIYRRQIYKDTINSTLQWSDYQLRPNWLVTCVVAPEMFNVEHIWPALKQVEHILLGKYGIKTLDPNDSNYVGDYVNDDDSSDPKRARGYNYHNGPEWLWLMGYYCRAKLLWSSVLEKDSKMKGILKQTIKHVQDILTAHQQLIFSTDWKGLPELTNANGQHCPYSCEIQAWSMSTLLETMYDLDNLHL